MLPSGAIRSSRRARWLLLAACAAGCGAPAPATLVLQLRDAASGAATSARIEVLGAGGEAFVAGDALPITQECAVAPPSDLLGDFLGDRLGDELGELAQGWVRTDRIENPHTGTTQFYAQGSARLVLPPGRYRVRAFKGIEYEVETRELELREGEERALPLPLVRWSDLPAQGWYAADDHLHITRRSAVKDRSIARWMAAEDLQVANLLQMGTSKQFGVTPQRAFGDAGAYREGGTLLLSGQEHPRTHFLGHTIVLGGSEPIDLRDEYIVYQRSWRAARAAGGLSGFAHWGLGAGTDGLAIDGPSGLLSFVEVLQFEYPHYAVWYELLSLGVRLAPTAGTDFPCGPWSVPGRERFYTRVEGELSRESWLAGLRRGRTFVTNGPLLELRAGDAQIGDELVLDGPGPVSVEGAVRFDPTREDIQQVELVRSGEPLPVRFERAAPGLLRFAVRLEVADAGWLALRVSGDKLGETPPVPFGWPAWALGLGQRISGGVSIREREAFVAGRSVAPAAAHTAAIYLSVAGRPPLGRQPGAAALARRWLERLDALETRLSDERIDEIPIWDQVPYSDGVSAAHLRRNRPALLAEIAAARRYYADREQ